MSNFETLPNEVIFTLFEYIDDVHLFRAFYGLNIRFNDLLFAQYRLVHLDFRSIYRQDFNLICQHYLPFVIDRTVSLHLSDSDDTPEQIYHFLSFIPSFDPFIQLQSLSLSNVQDRYIINPILRSLHSLVHINLSIYSANIDSTYAVQLIDTIWSLPNLLSCQLQNIIPHETFLSAPTIISSSLRYLIIDDLNRSFTEFVRLCQYTPTLDSLQISIWDIHLSDSLPSLESSVLSRLTFSFQGSLQMLINILTLTPNVQYLTIQIDGLLLSGDQWKQIIDDNLPNLQQLQFLMKHRVAIDIQGEEQITDLFQTFQTKFWLKQHQWFVQYHWNLDQYLHVYTYPYISNNFQNRNCFRYQSTCPSQIHPRIFDRVVHLSYELTCHSSWHFSNIRSLHLDLPCHELFWSIIPTMHFLFALTIERLTNTQGYSQLQTLFTRAMNLRCLTWKSSNLSLKHFFQLHCSTIDQLDFFQSNQYFTRKQCQGFIYSSFSHRCEILRIQIKKPADVLQFITKIPSLRTFIFQYDPYSDESQLIDWLTARIPRTCFVSVNPKNSTIRIWIR